MPKSLSSSTPSPRAGKGTRCGTPGEEWGWEGSSTPSPPASPQPLQSPHLPLTLQPCLCSHAPHLTGFH